MSSQQLDSFLLNGEHVSCQALPVQTTLLDFLRDRGLTGAKEGCAEGECGACTVLLAAPKESGCIYRPVNSCLMFLPMAAGQEIYTVEALAQKGELAEAQKAMAALGGSQCGYCTPGFVMSLFAEHHRPGREGPCDPESMGGNLCRCTGYRPIRDAALKLGNAPEGPFKARLDRPAPCLSAVAYHARESSFFRPVCLEECFALARQYPLAKFVAGATDMGVDSNLKFQRWPQLISLEAIPELREFSEGTNGVFIGAGLTLTEIAERWAKPPQAFQEWLPLFASPSLRNRATLGGNLSTASPVGDGAPLLIALGAVIHIAGPDRKRTIRIDSFFSGYRRTVLEPGELIVKIEIPKPFAAITHFSKASKRRLDDISTVAAAMALDLDSKGRVQHARLAFGGVAATPLRAVAAEEAMIGNHWNQATIERAQAAIERTLHPISDHRGSAEYRLEVAKSLLEKWGAVPGPCPRRPESPPRAECMPHIAHESARAHVTGEALYTDDLLNRYPGVLHAWPVLSPHAHAVITYMDLAPALTISGVVTTLSASDVPGEGDCGSARHDEPLFPSEVMFHQQPVAWVLAETIEAARLGAAQVQVEYQSLPRVLTISEAIAEESYLAGPARIATGDTSVIETSPLQFSGELSIGGQEHFYIETQCALACLDETGNIALHSSTQHPSETQEVVARVLGIARNQVTVECLRMGGAFGGKEVQGSAWAALAALGAWKTKRPVRVRLTRALDMAITGKRHPFLARYTAGFALDGKLQGVKINLFSDGGWCLDLSEPILWRALFHCDNAYKLPAAELTGYVCRTHKTSQTAFRGFGGPQGMLVIEEILDEAARRLGLPPEEVRERNFYQEGDVTHYGETVKHAERIGIIWNQLKKTSEFDRRRAEIDRFNREHADIKRGIAVTPVKFGISFTATLFNQAGALVLIYRDGSVQVNHGGTEMGQGLHTKIRQIAAQALGIDPERVRVMPPRTDKVPNTSATAASAGTDLNGAAVLDACQQLRDRLKPVAHSLGPDASFAQICEAAYRRRIPLFAQGYYQTPEIHFDPKTGHGKPFHYYAYAAAVSEVEVDRFTGMYRMLRTDILEDVGESIVPLVDRGQIEGGFIQGAGWLTLEELLWDSQGRLATAGASTYKLPSWSELPEIFNVGFLERAGEPDVVMGSKAVGEPPLMAAISVREAIRDAIAAFGNGGPVKIPSPATPEKVFFAIRQVVQVESYAAPR